LVAILALDSDSDSADWQRALTEVILS